MQINYSNIHDAQALKDLYQAVAAASNTLGMLPEECTLEYFEDAIKKSNADGIIIGAYENQELVGFIYAYKLNLKNFSLKLIRTSLL